MNDNKIPPLPDVRDFNALREWRMAHNRESYESHTARYEGFAGIPAEMTDLWCSVCERRIDHPHDLGCTVGARESAISAPIEANR